jgi:hypothetical protein
MKPKSSGVDSRGHIYIDCAECKCGGNGDKSCSAGAKHKRINKGMCFSGELLEKYSL